jgi:hypothetical protein
MGCAPEENTAARSRCDRRRDGSRHYRPTDLETRREGEKGAARYRGCGRQITSSRPAFVHVKGAPGCGNRSPELRASPRRGGNGHRWTALLELRRKHIEIASDADRLTRWFRSGPSDNPSRRERHQPRHGKSGSHETRRWREKDSNPRSPRRGQHFFETSPEAEEVRFATDSLLEGAGFEPSVPRDSDDGFSLDLSGPTPFGERPTVRIPLGPPPECALPVRRRGFSSRCRRNQRSHGKTRPPRPGGV